MSADRLMSHLAVARLLADAAESSSGVTDEASRWLNEVAEMLLEGGYGARIALDEGVVKRGCYGYSRTKRLAEDGPAVAILLEEAAVKVDAKVRKIARDHAGARYVEMFE